MFLKMIIIMYTQQDEMEMPQRSLRSGEICPFLALKSTNTAIHKSFATCVSLAA